MNIEKSTITKLQITGATALDPITVIAEDLGPCQGKIIIECYGQSWSAYWGGMGNRTIAEFFCRCDEHYLAGKLSSIWDRIPDYDNLKTWLKTSVIKLRREDEISKEEARTHWDDIDLWIYNDEESLRSAEGGKLALAIIGDDWWTAIPTAPNPEYQYLCRIINAVKAALKSQVVEASVPVLGTMPIPVDATREGKRPHIYSAMKAECIGQFWWQEQADYYDEHGNVVEHVATRTVPWELCKEIYRRMAMVANLSLGLEVAA